MTADRAFDVEADDAFVTLYERRRNGPAGPRPAREIFTSNERAAIELVLEGATYREIARVMDVPPDVAAGWLSSALDKMGWGS